jgi:carbonic anhydrase/acetyltransferase-like protein (isoleucine patch superfamily)
MAGRNVVIIGNSAAARECFWLARETWGDSLRFKGFLAFEGHKENLRELAGLELGSDESFTPEKNDVFIIGIGSPSLRIKAFQKWKARGTRFLTLLHPSVVLTGEVTLGEANILSRNSVVSCNAVLGSANYLNGGVVIGHDASVGDGNFWGPLSLVLGEARIGSGNSFGACSVVLEHARIGDGNTIAPGAFIYKGCGNDRLMAGNPALDVNR